MLLDLPSQILLLLVPFSEKALEGVQVPLLIGCILFEEGPLHEIQFAAELIESHISEYTFVAVEELLDIFAVGSYLFFWLLLRLHHGDPLLHQPHLFPEALNQQVLLEETHPEMLVFLLSPVQLLQLGATDLFCLLLQLAFQFSLELFVHLGALGLLVAEKLVVPQAFELRNHFLSTC